MTERTTVHRLQVATVLHRFIEQQVLPGTGIDPAAFWLGFDRVVHDLAPKNAALLSERERLQSEIDAWHRANPGPIRKMVQYRKFLQKIGLYLVPVPAKLRVTTKNVDAELALQAGPQLVVPVINARYALNAANARWGIALRRALRHRCTPEDGGAERGRGYNPVRGDKVIAYAARRSRPPAPAGRGLACARGGYRIEDGKLRSAGRRQPQRAGQAGTARRLARRRPSAELDPAGATMACTSTSRSTATRPIGRDDPAGVSDVVLEAALTTILDWRIRSPRSMPPTRCWPTRNWLGLMSGDLPRSFDKGGKTMTRRLNADRDLHRARRRHAGPAGPRLMFVRNVGHLMTNPAMLLPSGSEIPEGILDAIVTTPDRPARPARAADDAQLAPRIGLYRQAQDARARRSGLYRRPVRPRSRICSACPRHTIKVGIMDEERRTSVNLKACIHAASRPRVFINTGFLDRTGDEMHTSMQAGPMIRKGEMKSSAWIKAYEDSNVLIGLACGLRGKAQIGKGMWAMPDLMADMLEQKIAHPQAGANTAWVPSPTAATLHALHYHQVDVFSVQEALERRERGRAPSLEALLTVPLATGPNWSADDIQRNSTTTRRASSAMSCAGSTRASAAPRCPTSTTSA